MDIIILEVRTDDDDIVLITTHGSSGSKGTNDIDIQPPAAAGDAAASRLYGQASSEHGGCTELQRVDYGSEQMGRRYYVVLFRDCQKAFLTITNAVRFPRLLASGGGNGEPIHTSRLRFGSFVVGLSVCLSV
jgi:hypothetical protein